MSNKAMVRLGGLDAHEENLS
jgi:glucosamine--fructose-6-phosphate aminotransferase (isomerizing)